MMKKLAASLLPAAMLLLFCSTQVVAQTDTASSSAQEGEGAAEEAAAGAQEGFAGNLAEADRLAGEIERLRKELDSAEGEEKTLLRDQLVRTKEEYRKQLSTLVKDSADSAAEPGAANERSRVEQLVKAESEALQDDIEAIRSELKELRTQTEQATPEEGFQLRERIARLAARLDELLREHYEQTQRLTALGLGAAADTEYLDDLLQTRAQNLKSRIELVTTEIKAETSALAKASEEEKKAIEAKIKALEEKKATSAASLRATIDVMAKRELNTAAYSQLLISATGQITGDILDTEVAMGLAQQWMERVGEWALDNGPGILVKLIVVLLILLVFKMLSGIIARMVRKGVSTSKLNLSQLLQDFFVSVAAKAVMVIGVLVALSQLGVQVGPLLAGLGVVGFIVGFALQDTLSNFASGMMILVYRPYDVGDVIEAGGVMGKVKQMSLVSTTVMTPDNQKLVVPNNKIWGGVIRNVTAQVSRRVDLTFGIGYGDDIAHAERVLREIVEGHELVLKDPEPVIKLHTLGESSVDFVVRPWTKTGDYWNVYWDLTRAVKERFDAEGISIPFPQRDVHLFQEKPAS